MTTKFKPSFIQKWAVHYTNDQMEGRFQLFDSEESAMFFAEDLQVKKAIEDFRWGKTLEAIGHPNPPTAFTSDIHITEVKVVVPSEATEFVRKHGSSFPELPLCQIRQGWKIEEWGGGPIDFKAPTLPAGAWSHEPDDKGDFVIRFADGSVVNAKIQKP